MSVINKDNLGNKDLLFAYTQGLDVDQMLYSEEVAVQKAWAEGLFSAGYFDNGEYAELIQALEAFKLKVIEGSFAWDVNDEDIHMSIERFLTEQCGDLGKRIHMGRSRNDLIATTLRLFVYNQLVSQSAQVSFLVNSIEEFAEGYSEVIVPGMTHLQAGQAMTVKQMVLAHKAAFKRDLKRLKAAQETCLEYMPLGSAACTGSHLKLDFTSMAKSLGFKSTVVNTYDAVSDRDFMIEALNAYSMTAAHVTRMMEEVIYLSSTHVGLFKLPKDLSTGSSIMPNKRNPDVPELARAKMNRVITAAIEATSIFKATTPSYCSDLHEMKRTFISANNELAQTLTIVAPFMSALSVDKDVAIALLNKGHILATDIANYLVEEKAMPFREAYLKLKEDIISAESQGLQVHQLDEYKAHFSFEKALAARSHIYK